MPRTLLHHHIAPAAIAIFAMLLPLAAAAGEADALERYLMSEAAENTGLDMTNIYDALDARNMPGVEGLWRMSGNEGSFAIIADEGAVFYRIIVIDGEDASVAPGDIMGACTAAGKSNSYDARIFTSVEDGKLGTPKRFTITVQEDGRLIMVPVNNSLRVNLWRILPYMFRASVTRVNDRPNNLDGAIRVYPQPVNSPLTPRCL